MPRFYPIDFTHAAVRQDKEPFGTSNREHGACHINLGQITGTVVALPRCVVFGHQDERFPQRKRPELAMPPISEQWPTRGRRQQKYSNLSVSVCDLVSPDLWADFGGQASFWGREGEEN